MDETEIILELQSQFGNEILNITPFPRPYCKDNSSIKAIYLGCDPSNKHSHNLPYAFALESKLPVFNKFLKDHSSNLCQIGLSWDTVYVQNLCQNYFEKETSKNQTLWKKTSKWRIPHLKQELQVFTDDIPVLLTSSYLFNVLVNSKWRKIKPKQFYNCEIEIPIPKSENLLERYLIPFYRNRQKVDYHLSNPDWENFKLNIIWKLKHDKS